MNLRKKILAASATVVALAITSSSTFGLGTLNISRTSGYYAGSGGEFTVQFKSGGGSPSVEEQAIIDGYDAKAKIDKAIQVFCLELDTYISVPSDYVYSIDNQVLAKTKAIGKGTDYLYSQFAQGLLADYDFGIPAPGIARASDAQLLQKAIWYSQGFNVDINDNKFIKAALGYYQFGNSEDLRMDSGNALGTKALNLYTSTRIDKQSQAVWQRVPDGGSTVALLGLGLSVLAFLSRHRNG